MTDIERLWQNKSDTVVRTAAGRLSDYNPEARSVILAELKRRNMDAGPTPDEVHVFEESVERLNLAPRSRRFVARSIDTAISVAPLLFLVADTEVPLGKTPSDVLPFGVFLAGCLWLVGCQLLSGARRGGQSLGKRLLGMVVVDSRTLAPCSIWQALCRNGTLSLLGPLEGILIFNKRRQRVGDLLAGTLVVMAVPNKEPWETGPPIDDRMELKR